VWGYYSYNIEKLLMQKFLPVVFFFFLWASVAERLYDGALFFKSRQVLGNSQYPKENFVYQEKPSFYWPK
jgi:hypothetical protein